MSIGVGFGLEEISFELDFKSCDVYAVGEGRKGGIGEEVSSWDGCREEVFWLKEIIEIVWVYR